MSVTFSQRVRHAILKAMKISSPVDSLIRVAWTVNKKPKISALICFTDKPVDKGHLKENPDMAFINKWPLFRG
jgi:hypothetical protein